MKQQQVLQALDEIAQPMLQSQPLWSRDEVIAMQVQTFRQYRLIAQKHGIHETTVKRMCERVINNLKQEK